MRCGRAQRLLTVTLDGELSARRARALERHLAGCGPCTREMAATRRLHAALDGLAREAPVPPALEQATLRRVRLAAAAEAEAPRRAWWRRALPAPGLALAAGTAALVLAVGLARRSGDPAPATSPAEPVAAVVAPEPTRLARAPEPRPGPSTRPAAPARAARAAEPAPAEPPPELAALPDLFVDLPLLKDLEKIEHFEAIRLTTLDEPRPRRRPGSNG